MTNLGQQIRGQIKTIQAKVRSFLKLQDYRGIEVEIYSVMVLTIKEEAEEHNRLTKEFVERTSAALQGIGTIVNEDWV